MDKDIFEKEKKIIMAKDIVVNNPIFSKAQIQDFYKMFTLFCDNRREIDVRELITTAKTLGYDKNYRVIYDGMVSISEDLDGDWVNFERFLVALTDKLGHPTSEEGRRQMFTLVDLEGKQRLTFSDLRRISEGLKYNLNDEEIQEVIKSVAGKNKRDITWEQFNAHIAKKIQKKNSFF